MATDLQDAKSIVSSMARATIALSLLEDLASEVSAHDTRIKEVADRYEREHRRLNDVFVSNISYTVRQAREQLDKLDAAVSDNGDNDDD